MCMVNVANIMLDKLQALMCIAEKRKRKSVAIIEIHAGVSIDIRKCTLTNVYEI